MVLFTGSTVEEAIQKGLNELNIPRKKGIFWTFWYKTSSS